MGATANSKRAGKATALPMANQPDPSSRNGSEPLPQAPLEGDAVAGAQAEEAAFEIMVEKPPPGLFRRFLTTQRHLSGLAFGGINSWVRQRKTLGGKRGWSYYFFKTIATITKPFLKKELVAQSFPVQLRRRLEILGPTYIKLGQVLSLREDLLPTSITQELKNLLDRLPIVPFERYCELIEEGVGKPVNELFTWISEKTLGSASIAQTHRATLLTGEQVIIKVVKPGIKKLLQRDAILIGMLGRILEWVVGQYQPKRVLDEFTEYTLREVDLRLEADNADTFSANFADNPMICFPKIYHDHSSESVLTMEFFAGIKPDSAATAGLSERDRDQLIDSGAGAIICMLYRDGFFHADLHPGNLIILDGPRCGFIDLGMVGRFEDKLRRTMLYYYYCLVTGDSENAARYLAMVAQPAKGGQPEAFRRAVTDISRRWARAANFANFSLAQLIMQSVSMGGRYRMYFPMEMVLMVKALVTFEGVGNLLKPGFDVAAVSQKHISKLFVAQFNPINLFKESLRGAPEVVDALVKAPLLITKGLRYLEQQTDQPSENPFAYLRGTLLGGASLIAGAIVLSFDKTSWPIYGGLFAISLFFMLRKER